MTPDEEQFRADLEGAAFLAGQSQGFWRVDMDSIKWPYIVAVVTSASGQEYTIRFQCDGYPAAPTAKLWNSEQDCPAFLEAAQYSPKMRQTLSTLKAGEACFYVPCDRRWLGHWGDKYPAQEWDSERGIASYLEVLRDALD